MHYITKTVHFIAVLVEHLRPRRRPNSSNHYPSIDGVKRHHLQMAQLSSKSATYPWSGYVHKFMNIFFLDYKLLRIQTVLPFLSSPESRSATSQLRRPICPDSLHLYCEYHIATLTIVRIVNQFSFYGDPPDECTAVTPFRCRGVVVAWHAAIVVVDSFRR